MANRTYGLGRKLPKSSDTQDKYLQEDPTAPDGVKFSSGTTNTDSTKIAKAVATTKGDILVATGSAAVVRQGVGTNHQVLAAASGQTNGIVWETPDAANTAYTPTTTANWTGADPTTVFQALDRIAAALVAAGHTP